MKRLIITESQYNNLIKESHAFQEMIQIAYNLATHHGGVYHGKDGDKLKRVYSSDNSKTGPMKFESGIQFKGTKILAKLILDEKGVLEISINNTLKYKRPEHIKKMLDGNTSKINNETIEEEFEGILETFNEVIMQSRLDQLNDSDVNYTKAKDYNLTFKHANQRDETIPEYLFKRFFGDVEGPFNNEINEIDRRAPKTTTIYLFNQKLKEIIEQHPSFVYGQPINAILNPDKTIKEKYTSTKEMDKLIDFYYENLP